MEILKIRENSRWADVAATWFHDKWKVPLEAYQESIADCIKGKQAVPQWYIAVEDEEIIGGLGVIENDFHDRKDLTPNVCAVYVEKAYRCQGIAGKLLAFVREDMKSFGIDPLYLITSHTSFYERYGWEYLCMVQGDGESEMSRMYIYRNNMTGYLEKMDEFFNNRLDGYEEHMLNTIESAKEFYPFTAGQLPMGNDVRVLDLGCGTGLELGYYFEVNPLAWVTGIDLAEEMLKALMKKYADKNLTVVQGSYFEIPLGEDCYDAVVSVESLHHFTMDEKIPLYKKVYQALKSGGYFLITDYFALTDEQERYFRQELLRLKAEQGLCGNEFYHYDTPLTVEHEIDALRLAGFYKMEVIGQWSATHTIKAYKM